MDDNRIYPLFVLFSLGLFLSLKYISGSTSGFNNVSVRCIKRERQALLKFKRDLGDDSGLLSSWDNKECCKWWGVKCNNRTAHVIHLDLRGSWFNGRILSGEVSLSALIGLQHLRYLDLSNNIFAGSRIGEAIGSLHRLKYLNLSHCFFTGVVPDQLGNLSNLQSLDLNRNNLTLNNLVWLSQLRLLRQLDLSWSHLTISNWMQVIFNLPFLQELHLHHCELGGQAAPSMPLLLNSSAKSLSILDLSNNHLTSSSTYYWLFNISENLVSIDLSLNDLEGPIPDAFGKVLSLKDIRMGANHLTGEIPKSFQNLSHLYSLALPSNNLSEPFPEFLKKLSKGAHNFLSELNLDNNRFTGRIPERIREFSKLEILYLSSNLLEGLVTEIHFSAVSKLKELSLSFNSLTLSVGPEWIPTFQLNVISLANCSMGPHFPQWLRTQNIFSMLDISSNGISDTIPNWFWNTSHKLESLDIHGNMFWGSVSFLCGINNDIRLIYLDLSDNLFTGDLPDCWMNMKELSVLNLRGNNFSGQIPESLGYLQELRVLNLGHNSFVGEFPSSVRNCSLLEIIDVGRNHLSGNIPHWIGTHLTYLAVLSLRLNNFSGNIPQEICQLSYIQVLDLSCNNVTGKIPQCFNNFTFLVEKERPEDLIGYHFEAALYIHYIWVQWKRQESEFRETLRLLKINDLSNNKFVGQIPKEIASLRALISLNLSVNHLTGNIFSSIDQMEMLESLDLSRNQISGEIPISLARLNFLALLDLSYNNLSGRIPSGTQLQGFNPSTYIGNSGLCGLPLDKCPGDDSDRRPTDHGKDDNVEDEVGFMSKEFYIGIGLGFLVGLWGVVAVLFKDSWRNAYLRFLNYACDWFYVRSMVYCLRLKRMLSA